MQGTVIFLYWVRGIRPISVHVWKKL